MSKAEEAVSDVSVGVARSLERLGGDRTLPPLAVVATGVQLGIAIGLATAVDDIAAARALLRVIEDEIEVGHGAAADERVTISALLREAVR